MFLGKIFHLCVAPGSLEVFKKNLYFPMQAIGNLDKHNPEYSKGTHFTFASRFVLFISSIVCHVPVQLPVLPAPQLWIAR